MPTEANITTVQEFIQNDDSGTRPISTQKVYRFALSNFEKFMGFDDETLFKYARNKKMQPSKDLQRYQATRMREGKSRSSTKIYRSAVRAFLVQNEWTLTKKRTGKKQECKIADEALTLDLLQKMMGVATLHQKVILETMISTGARIGSLAACRVPDLHMECDPPELRIPGSLMKNGKPVTVYLTSECKKYMEIWLANRDAYLESTEKKARNLLVGDRSALLFCCSRMLFESHFRRMVRTVAPELKNINPDAGEKDTGTRYAIHCHSVRKYFYSKMLPALGEIITNGLMGHTAGYLEESYGRIPTDERRAKWKENEHLLFILDASTIEAKKTTEAQGKEIAALRAENQELKRDMETRVKGLESMLTLFQERILKLGITPETIEKNILRERKEENARQKGGKPRAVPA